MLRWRPVNALDEMEQTGAEIVGAGVRRARLSAAMSQRQLAWRAGVSQSLVSKLENGHLRGLRYRTLVRVFGALHVPAERVFPGEPPASRRRLPGQPST